MKSQVLFRLLESKKRPFPLVTLVIWGKGRRRESTCVCCCLSLSVCADAVAFGGAVVEQDCICEDVSQGFLWPLPDGLCNSKPEVIWSIIKILLLQQSDQHPRENEMFSAIILIATSAQSLFAGPVTITFYSCRSACRNPCDSTVYQD